MAILGATGSVGEQTLDVVRSQPERLRVRALAARGSGARLVELAREFGPKVVGLSDASACVPGLDEGPWDLVTGDGALEALLDRTRVDLVVAATPGLAALRCVLTALERSIPVALANKEVLVAAGDLVERSLLHGDGYLLPVDSEHVALHMALRDEDPEAVDRLILTCSGGPFRTWTLPDMARAGPEAALRHPNWTMGSLITINSATLMNKGLEVLEAQRLFGWPLDRIDVVVHPQSVIHSLVALQDGSLLAQLAGPDMRLPIQYALTYPKRHPSPVRPLDLAMIGTLGFEPVRHDAFPALSLATTAGKLGGTAPAVLVAANEEAVSAFLQGRIGFLNIAALVEGALSGVPLGPVSSAEDVEDAQRLARTFVTQWLEDHPQEVASIKKGEVV